MDVSAYAQNSEFDLACLKYPVPVTREKDMRWLPPGQIDRIDRETPLRLVGHPLGNIKRALNVKLVSYSLEEKHKHLWLLTGDFGAEVGDSGGPIIDLVSDTVVAVVAVGQSKQLFAAPLRGGVVPCAFSTANSERGPRDSGGKANSPSTEQADDSTSDPAPRQPVKNSAYVAVDARKLAAGKHDELVKLLMKAFVDELLALGIDVAPGVNVIADWDAATRWESLRDKYTHLVVAIPTTETDTGRIRTTVRVEVGKIREQKLVEFGELSQRFAIDDEDPHGMLKPSSAGVFTDANVKNAKGAAANLMDSVAMIFPELRGQYLYAVRCFRNELEKPTESLNALNQAVVAYLSRNLADKGPVGLVKSPYAVRMSEEQNVKIYCSDASPAPERVDATAHIEFEGALLPHQTERELVRLPLYVTNRTPILRWDSNLLSRARAGNTPFNVQVSHWREDYQASLDAGFPLTVTMKMLRFCLPKTGISHHDVLENFEKYVKSQGRRIGPDWECVRAR